MPHGADNAWAALPVAVPLLAAALLAGLNRRIPRAGADGMAMAATAISGGISLLLLAASRQHLLVAWMGGWAPRFSPFSEGRPVAVGIALAVDPLGAGMAAWAAILVLTSLIFSRRYFDSVGTLYHVLLLVFFGAMCGFSLTGDLFDLFVWFELMSAAAFALCGYRTEEAGPIQGALNFGVTNVVALLLALSGLGLIYGRTGALNLAEIGTVLAHRNGAAPDGLIVVAFLLILCGFLVKAAIVPFHFWLADAHAVAPTPVCLLFSGVMVELGLYAVARVYWAAFAPALGPAAPHLRAVLVGAGVVTAAIGALMCFVQRHLKRLLAFSTIAHMGLMLIGVGLLSAPALAGASEYVLAHGAAKAALFMAAGVVLHRLGSVDAVELHGRGRRICGLWGVTAMVAITLGLAGLPPFGSVDGSDAITAAAGDLGYGWVRIAFDFATIVTAGAVLRMIGKIYFGWGPRAPIAPQGEGNPDEKRETEAGFGALPVTMWGPIVALGAFGFSFSHWPGMEAAVQSAAARFVSPSIYAAEVLHGVVVALPPPPAAAVGSYWTGILVPVAAVALAAVALRRPRLLPVRWARYRLDRRRLPQGNLVQAPLAGLRRLHSGHLGDYVAWLTLGVAILGALFAVWTP